MSYHWTFGSSVDTSNMILSCVFMYLYIHLLVLFYPHEQIWYMQKLQKVTGGLTRLASRTKGRREDSIVTRKINMPMSDVQMATFTHISIIGDLVDLQHRQYLQVSWSIVYHEVSTMILFVFIFSHRYFHKLLVTIESFSKTTWPHQFMLFLEF